MEACNCPQLPALDELSAAELDKVVGAPLRCTSCGSELELRCPEGHVHAAPRTMSPNTRRPPIVRTRPMRTCPQGHELEPGQRRCLLCKPLPAPRSHRTYKTKTCRCGASFMPTGPRAVLCPTCRFTKKRTLNITNSR